MHAAAIVTVILYINILRSIYIYTVVCTSKFLCSWNAVDENTKNQYNSIIVKNKQTNHSRISFLMCAERGVRHYLPVHVSSTAWGRQRGGERALGCQFLSARPSISGVADAEVGGKSPSIHE